MPCGLAPGIAGPWKGRLQECMEGGGPVWSTRTHSLWSLDMLGNIKGPVTPLFPSWCDLRPWDLMG
jgi:hypothetical protein